MFWRALNAFLLFFFLSTTFSATSHARSLVKIIDWRDLSDHNQSADGRQALEINRDSWQHAETEHFIYHFHDVKEAETVYIHAEEYYRWVKEMFGVTSDEWPGKCHVYIFEDKTIWQEFNKKPGERLPGAEAYTNGTELFIYREPFFLEPQRTLAHEITHIVVHRFLKGTLPLFLNEGVAEFMSYKAIARLAGGNEYAIRTIEMMPEERFIAVDKLVRTKTYPESPEEKKFFYRESELLARYLLLNHDKKKFYELLTRTAEGEDFECVLKSLYELDLESFETQFRLYAVPVAKKQENEH